MYDSKRSIAIVRYVTLFTSCHIYRSPIVIQWCIVTILLIDALVTSHLLISVATNPDAFNLHICETNISRSTRNLNNKEKDNVIPSIPQDWIRIPEFLRQFVFSFVIELINLNAYMFFSQYESSFSGMLVFNVTFMKNENLRIYVFVSISREIPLTIRFIINQVSK